MPLDVTVLYAKVIMLWDIYELQKWKPPNFSAFLAEEKKEEEKKEESEESDDDMGFGLFD